MRRKLLSVAMAIMMIVTVVPAAVTIDTQTVFAGTIAQFTADSRWANGTSWGSSQTPKLSKYGSSGCCAYCADYVKYCYGLDSPKSGTAFYNASEIRAGDVIYIAQGGSIHYFVVTGRSGSTLYTAEGAFSGKVKIGSYYYVSGNSLGGDYYGRPFVNGWHYTGTTTHTHTYGITYITPADCLQQGQELRYCTVCGHEDKKIIPKTNDHNFGSWTTTKAATCTAAGTKTRKCKRCGKVETASIAKLGHNYVHKKSATQEYDECSRCGNKTNIKDLHTHSYSEWKTTKAVTCTEAGQQTRTCSACGATETKTIAATGHNYSHVKVLGEEMDICTKCGQTANVKKVDEEHKFSDWTTVIKPGCNYKGQEARVCMTCGAVETRSTAALGHNYVSKQSDTQKYDECTRCKKKINVINTPSIKKLTKVTKGFTVTWDEANCIGYQIRYSTKSDMSSAKKVTINNASTTKKKITKLKSEKKYYVQIRTIHNGTDGKVYSLWSAKKSIKTK